MTLELRHHLQFHLDDFQILELAPLRLYLRDSLGIAAGPTPFGLPEFPGPQLGILNFYAIDNLVQVY